MTDIAKNIKRLREAANMSQLELAEAVGVTRSMITQIERGTKSCTMQLGAAIAEALNCPIERLYDEYGTLAPGA